MTSAEVMARTVVEKHFDFLRGRVTMVASELMEVKVSGPESRRKGEGAETKGTLKNSPRPFGRQSPRSS